MKRRLLALAVIASPALAAEAQTASPPETAATVIHLQEQAQRMMKRDRLTATLRVDAVEADAARLQAEINRRMTAALDHAKALADVTTVTGGYSVFQERPAPQATPRWHGTQILLLAGRDAPTLLALTGRLQQDGLVLSSLGYELTPDAAKSVQDDLTAEALARLNERAEHIAASLGLAVGHIRDLHIGNANGAQPAPRQRLDAQATAAPAPVAEPGDAMVSVSIDAEILLVPNR